MYRLLVMALLLCAVSTHSQAQTTVAVTDYSGSDASSGGGNVSSVAAKVYSVADEMPSFPGGDDALAKFLRLKLQYPEEALNKDVTGKVYISFVVDERGHLLDIKVAKGIGHGLDQEALRLVRIMPWWNPGKIKGLPVPVAYTIPIVFRAK